MKNILTSMAEARRGRLRSLWRAGRLLSVAAACLVLSTETAVAMQPEEEAWIEQARSLARPLRSFEDIDGLADKARGRRLVLLGEASHGTHEFYVWRDRISRRLIEEDGFSFIAVEGDWASIQRLNEYVKGDADPAEGARGILKTFDRWPVWLWANEEIVDLAEWLRRHNAALPREERVGIYGIDVYDPWKSMDRAIRFLKTAGEETVAAARRHYAEWARYRDDGHRYARAVFAFLPSAEDGVDRVVEKIRRHRPDDDSEILDAWFDAKQSARVVQSAERHFRKMAEDGPGSWNARAKHMHATVVRLLDRYGAEARGIVWAHNTHVGDARATPMRETGQVNIGQLALEEIGAEHVFRVGFGTAQGNVVAGREWGSPLEIMTIPPPAPGSVDELLARLGKPGLWMAFSPADRAGAIAGPRGQRAIGVTYRPEGDRQANFVPTVLPERYEAFVFFEETRALQPLVIEE